MGREFALGIVTYFGQSEGAGWYCNFLGLPGHLRSRGPCVVCGASSDPGWDGYRLNFRKGAEWKIKVSKTMAQGFAQCKKIWKYINLFLLPRGRGGLGLSLLAVLKDLLHALFFWRLQAREWQHPVAPGF